MSAVFTMIFLMIIISDFIVPEEEGEEEDIMDNGYLCELLTQPFLDSQSILFWLTMGKHFLLHLEDLFNGRKLTNIVFMRLTPIFRAAILKVQSIAVQWKIIHCNIQEKIWQRQQKKSLANDFKSRFLQRLPIKLTYQHSFVVIQSQLFKRKNNNK